MQIVVQVLPPAACLVAIKCSLLLMYAIGSPRGTNALDVTPQTACMLLAVVGSVACVSMCLGYLACIAGACAVLLLPSGR